MCIYVFHSYISWVISKILLKSRLMCRTFSLRLSCMLLDHSSQTSIRTSAIDFTKNVPWCPLASVSRVSRSLLWMSFDFNYLYYQNVHIEVTPSMLIKLKSNKDSYSFVLNIEFYIKFTAFSEIIVGSKLLKWLTTVWGKKEASASLKMLF